jgi:hypothetical protein
MKNTKQTKKVVISTRVVYHKIAEVTIEVPIEMYDDAVDEYLINNDVFSEQLEINLAKAELERGFGLNDKFDEIDSTTETRFDVYNSKGKTTWGGHI